jgi:hypothetical protein
VLWKAFAYDTDVSTHRCSAKECVENVWWSSISENENRKEVKRITQYYDTVHANITHLLHLVEDEWRNNIESGLPRLNELSKPPQNILGDFFKQFYSLEEDFLTSCKEYPRKLAATCTLREQIQVELDTTITKGLDRHGTAAATPTRVDGDISRITDAIESYSNSVLALADGVAKCFDSFSTKVLATILAWKRVEGSVIPGEHNNSKNLYFRFILLQLWKQRALCGDSRKQINVFDAEKLDDIMPHTRDCEAFEQKHGESINFEWTQLGDDLDTEKDPSDDEGQELPPKRKREDDEGSEDGSNAESQRQVRRRVVTGE